MLRLLFKLIICAGLAAAVAGAYLVWLTGDPIYSLREWFWPARYHRYDKLITAVARQHSLDPMLVKAVVWRESRFDPSKVGSAGERGLMQVTEAAASEWAAEEEISDFQAEKLLDPKINLSAGSWYLKRALEHWQHQKDPIPFALAEYNAGASRAQRWAGGREAVIAPGKFRRNIDFPTTRAYVDSVIKRYRFYQRRGSM